MSFFKNSKLYFSLLYLFLAAIFLFHYFVSGQAVYGDSIGYYSYLHSWYFDADADFSNEYQHIYNYENNNSPEPLVSPTVQIVGINSEGAALNHFSPGMAILLVPFYVLADGVAQIANFLGASIPQNGYSNIYQIFVGLGAIVYSIATLWLSEQLLALFSFSKKISRIAVFMLLFSTNLIYYLSFDTINSHFASLFISTFFFWYFFKNRLVMTKKSYLKLGGLVGILFLTRPQDGLIASLVLIDLFLVLREGKIAWRHFISRVLIFLLPVVLTVSLLISHWISLFDTISSHPYFNWLAGKNNIAFDMFGSLFHVTNGLFTRTPILLVCFILFCYKFYKRKINYKLGVK